MPRLTLGRVNCGRPSELPAMEAGTIAPADQSRGTTSTQQCRPAMEAGTIAPADDTLLLKIRVGTLDLQWRPGLLPRLTMSGKAIIDRLLTPAMEAGTIAPADYPNESS